MNEQVATPGSDGLGAATSSFATRPLRLAIAGGGTGGHIVPGLHLLDHLAEVDGALADLVWFHSGRAVEESVMQGLEKSAAPAAVERVALHIERAGGGAPGTARLTLRLPPSVLRARAVLRAHRSDVLIGLGGFVTAPAVIAARTLRIPVCLVEINASAGRATRTLAPLCARVLHAWRATLPANPGERHVLVGPPLARGFERRDAAPAALARARAELGFDPARPLLVVFGGSQGAGGLNDFVREHASTWITGGVSVLHQVGPGRVDEGAVAHEAYRAEEYVQDVRAALRAADVVLCRGGASTVAEVGAAGVPAWVVPYPHHPDQHQERNARELAGGVRIVAERDLGAERAEELLRLLSPEGAAERGRMALALARSVPADAARRILEEVGRVRRT